MRLGDISSTISALSLLVLLVLSRVAELELHPGPRLETVGLDRVASSPKHLLQSVRPTNS